MASYDTLIRTLAGPNDTLPLERLADYWVKKNVSAIATVAIRSMMDPVGTVYEIAPLRIVAFETADARLLYQLQRHEAAKAQQARHVVEHAISQHIEELVFFAREQFLTALLSLDVHATFQRDQFAVREER